MNLSNIVKGVGVVLASLAATATSAQAFSFTTNLDPGYTSTSNIFLNSVSYGGNTVTDFALVSSANILYNDLWRGGNTGAASSDRGDTATGMKLEAATNASVVASLGNLNLNNIIDTEDTGTFTMNLYFNQAVSNLFIWERGLNSRLGIQALGGDQNTQLIGNKIVLDSTTATKWKWAGFSINTLEIADAQRVGSIGISLADLGVSGPIRGIQVTSLTSYNGPDFKIIGQAANVADVPEPGVLAGLAFMGTGLLVNRRRQAAKA